MDGKLVARAEERLRQRAAKRENEELARRARLYERLPRVAEIDRQLAKSVVDAAAAAFRSGTDVESAIEAISGRNLALQAERAELLTAAGYAVDASDVSPYCEKCGDTGYVGGRMCSCLEELVRDEQRKELSQLLKLGEETFDSFDPEWYGPLGTPDREHMEMVYELCLQYARRFGSAGSSLFFTGGPGLGKTFLSTCIAREVAEKGYSVVYDTAISVFERFEKRKFAREQDEDADADVDRYMACDLLILDDLGTEMTTAFTQSVLYDLINTRMIRGRRMIISTNLSPEEMRRRYTGQICSRLDGEFTVVRFKGRDIRRLKRERD
ncbi:MAG: ATP-binding protein [Oscillospiraceae bacterium]|nr:ATP-binding protein [Oscillospiraceae bacterium]